MLVNSKLLVPLSIGLDAQRLMHLKVTCNEHDTGIQLLRALAEKGSATMMGRWLRSTRPGDAYGGRTIVITETEKRIAVNVFNPDDIGGAAIHFYFGVALATACDYLPRILPPLQVKLVVHIDAPHALRMLEKTHMIHLLVLATGSGRNILAYLARPPDDGRSTWCCSHLTLLSLSEVAYDGCDSKLVSFVTERFRHLENAGKGETSGQRRPPMYWVILEGRALDEVKSVIRAIQEGLPGLSVKAMSRIGGTYVSISRTRDWEM